MPVDRVDALPPLSGGGSTGTVTVEGNTPWPVADGGTGAMTPAAAAHNILNLPGSQPGDIWYRSSTTAVVRRARGIDGHVLTMVAGVPNWEAPTVAPGGSGTVNHGTVGQIAYYAASGTAISGSNVKTINGESLLGAGNITTPDTPMGGAQYDVLSKASATSGDVEWRGAGQRPNNNTVIGAGAFNFTATGSNNVAIGLNSLVSAVSGSNNIAIGNTAANANNSANNIAIGGQAFSLSPLGGNNIAIGYQAMQLANLPAGGNSNIAIGTWALRSLAGSSAENVVLGTNAGGGLTGGSRNICIGNGAGWYFGTGLSDPLTNAVQSIFIGAFAKPRADDAVNEIVIGSGAGSTSAALGNGSNTITLGNADVTALYTRAGLVIGDNPTGGALGPGSVNVTDGYYINGEELKAEATVSVAATAPTTPPPVAGDLWFDSVNNQLKTYNGTTWVVAGMAEPAETGVFLRQRRPGAPDPVFNWDWELSHANMNRSLLKFEHNISSPFLEMHAGEGKSAISIENLTGPGGGGLTVMAGMPGYDWSGDNMSWGTGVWAVATGKGDGIWVDNIGRSGIAIEHNGLTAESQGLFIIRHPNAPGPSVRLTHHAVNPHAATHQSRSESGNLLSDIMFAGVKGRGLFDVRGATDYADGAGILARATENWMWDSSGVPGNGAFGTSLEFQTTANGTVAPRTVLRLDHDGTPFVLHNGTLTDLFDLLQSGGGGLPTGGAVNNVLIKTGVADGIAGWSNTLNVAGVTVAGTTGSYRFEDQGTAGQQWQLRAANNRAVVVDPAGSNRFYVGQGVGDINISVPYHNAQGTLVVNRNPAAEHPFSANLHLVGRDFVANRLMIDSYFSTSELWFRGSRGTGAAPGLTSEGDVLGALVFTGCDTAGQMGWAGSAQITGRATEAWSATSRGTEIGFTTSPIGGGTSAVVFRLRNGLMVEAPGVATLLADMGLGTINVAAGYYQNGVRIGGFAPSVAWTNDIDPDNVTIFINSTGSDLVVSRISFVAEVANGDTATVTVVRAADGTALSAGTPVATPFDANPVSPGMVTTVNPVATTLPAGSRLGLQTVGNWLGNSVASITVYLDPQAV